MTEREAANARRRDRAAFALLAHGVSDVPSEETPRPRPEEAEETVVDLLCDLRHLADELRLDWEGLLARAERHHRVETARPMVEVTGEGLQIRDRGSGRLRADVWGDRGDAGDACAELDREDAGSHGPASPGGARR